LGYKHDLFRHYQAAFAPIFGVFALHLRPR